MERTRNPRKIQGTPSLILCSDFPPLCNCGCGNRVTKKGNKYLCGHSSKVKIYQQNYNPDHLCGCGCGKETKQIAKYKWNRFIIGHHAKLRTGWHHTEESKERLRKQHRGLKASQDAKDKMSISHKTNPVRYWLGKHHSEEHKQKIRDTIKKTYTNPEIRKKCGHPQIISKEHKEKVKQFMLTVWQNPEFREKLTGENANNWRGGITFEPYGLEFNNVLKKKVYERDNYTCQNPKCVIPGKKLDIHHIDYDKQNNVEINLITLCCICHPKTNRDRRRWTIFYQNIIKQKYGTYKEYKTS